jgi:small subunit ribosomal protein S21
VRNSDVAYPNFSEERLGVCVVKRKGESTEDLIRRFKKKFSKSGIIKELREKMYYEQPCIAKKKKRAQAILARKRDEEKMVKEYRRFRKRRKEMEEGE